MAEGGRGTMRMLSRDEAQTLAIGRALGGLLRAGDVVAIDGPLGAGKTRLVRGIALGMGIDPRAVSSPTFVIVNEYIAEAGEGGGAGRAREEWEESGPARRLFHVDAYRLSGLDELDSLGWDRVLAPPDQTDAAVAIEWAERIAQGGEVGGRPEHEVCRVRMVPVGGLAAAGIMAEGPAGEGEEIEPPAGERLIEVEAPAAWRGREGWANVARVAALLREGATLADEAAQRLPLPRGWGRCPVTRRPVPPDTETFPFADRRARLIDLGRWATGAYTISREIRPEDEPEV